MSLLAIAASLIKRASPAPETGMPEDPSTWRIWRLLEPHADYIFSILRALPDCPDEAAKSASYAAYFASRYIASQGLYAAAETDFRDILTTVLRVRGPDHPDTLATRHMIAYVTTKQGHHAAAETEYRDILTTRLRVLGPDHPNTLATRHNIAYVLAEQGHHAAAETEYRDILTTELRVLGPDHPYTKVTGRWVAYLEQRRASESDTSP